METPTRLTLLLTVVRDQLAAQLHVAEGHDTKAVALLGFDGIYAALLLGLERSHDPLLWLALAMVACSVGFCVAALWSGRYRLGPSVTAFYARHGARAPEIYEWRLLSSLEEVMRRHGPLLEAKYSLSLLGAVSLLLSLSAILVPRLFGVVVH